MNATYLHTDKPIEFGLHNLNPNHTNGIDPFKVALANGFTGDGPGQFNGQKGNWDQYWDYKSGGYVYRFSPAQPHILKENLPSGARIPAQTIAKESKKSKKLRTKIQQPGTFTTRLITPRKRGGATIKKGVCAKLRAQLKKCKTEQKLLQRELNSLTGRRKKKASRKKK